MSVNVIVVDDGSVAMRGAIDVLQGAPACSFLGDYPAIEQVRLVGDPTEPVVVVADPFAGPGSQITALPAMPRRTSVLIMSAHTGPEHVRAALQAGARGYVGKEIDATTLVAAVGALGAGGMYLAATMSEALLGRAADTAAGKPVSLGGLTARERDVLVMIAQGLTHKQIGTRLGLSKATVDTYVHRIRQKVGAVNKAGLTRVAMDLDLLHTHG